MIERNTHDFVTGAFHPVPRTVERSENVALVFGRELVAGVKTQVETGRMRLHEHIGNIHLIGELRMFSFVAGVGVIADVKPGPAIKAARAYAANVIGWQIFTDF